MFTMGESKVLAFENALSLSKKITSAQMQQELQAIRGYFKQKGIEKNGPLVTVTHSVEVVDGEQVMNMEILVPMDRSVALEPPYVFKPRFHLVNALYARHEGHPAALQSVYDALGAYMKEHNLQPITSGYNVTVREPQSVEDARDAIVDVYIGINPSIL